MCTQKQNLLSIGVGGGGGVESNDFRLNQHLQKNGGVE